MKFGKKLSSKYYWFPQKWMGETYLWELRNPKRFESPIFIPGNQGIFYPFKNEEVINERNNLSQFTEDFSM